MSWFFVQVVNSRRKLHIGRRNDERRAFRQNALSYRPSMHPKLKELHRLLIDNNHFVVIWKWMSRSLFNVSIWWSSRRCFPNKSLSRLRTNKIREHKSEYSLCKRTSFCNQSFYDRKLLLWPPIHIRWKCQSKKVGIWPVQPSTFVFNLILCQNAVR